LPAENSYNSAEIRKKAFMKIITIIGLILIMLGVVGLIYGGITYTTSKDVIDVGSVKLQVDQKKQIPLSPFAGAAAVAVGTILIIFGRRRGVRGNAL
jgi:uncharacterized membrane protein